MRCFPTHGTYAGVRWFAFFWRDKIVFPQKAFVLGLFIDTISCSPSHESLAMQYYALEKLRMNRATQCLPARLPSIWLRFCANA